MRSTPSLLRSYPPKQVPCVSRSRHWCEATSSLSVKTELYCPAAVQARLPYSQSTRMRMTANISSRIAMNGPYSGS
jgi:hypothetical protein